MDNEGVVRAYIAAVTAFDGVALAPLLHEDAVQIEHPNRLNPKGQKRGKAVMLADLGKGAALLEQQSYPILSLVAQGDRVVVETRWEGVLRLPVGTLAAGDCMVAHIAMTFRLRDGQVIEQQNYDCFEAF